MNLLNVVPFLLVLWKCVSPLEVVTEIVIGSDEVGVTEIGLDAEEVYMVQGYNKSRETVEYSNINNDTVQESNDDDNDDLKTFTLHIRTYRKKIYRTLANGTVVEDFTCVAPSSVEDFPEDLFTDEQLAQGAIILHFIAGVYCFTLLAVICNDYFIPSVECICEDLHISPNVAAATFMSVATSCPELFVNVISTFVTESDMGLGTIVGSALFNTLGVGALGGLAASKPILMERWPLARDCVIYSVTIAMLVAISWDGVVFWYEALALLVMYIFYFVLMFQNDRIQRSIRRLATKLCRHSAVDIGDDWDKNNNGDKTPTNGLSNECFVQTEKTNSNTHNVLSVYVIPVVCIEDSGKSNSMAKNQIELPHTGKGGMGVSNSLGANTLAVLMSLGMPWFIKTIKHGIGNPAQVYIDSSGVVYTIIGLLLAIWSLFSILSIGGYQMSKKTGLLLMLTYLVFVILAILSEMGVFFEQC
ncbi:sodium/potassium/calcium exchanger 2-like [Ctenocephalides felis]|uniref:sodium/potassium/calcium exchanger 2-like n=1 Tax=Ctenocephalides felis TaxID=7515 RepID=UPI000E6E2A33|nr:sodium/potassium/calcium exchanger 2-like [Ctenocephalides felis]